MNNAKWLAGLLAAGVLASGTLPARADTLTVDGVAWSYTVADGAATVTGAEPAEGTLAIPAELGGCPVTGIESNAFDGCLGVTNVVILGTVTNIGRYAFNKCTGLLSVTIPASVKRVRYYAFSGCSSLEAVHVHDLAAWCGIVFDSAYANPLYYARRLYLDGTEVAGKLVIPDGVEQIGDFAFSHFSGATNLVIPSSVKRIGRSSFLGCTGLASVVISSSVERIDDYAFADCGGLGTVEIPASVGSIGVGAFENCTGLEGIGVASGNAAYESEEGVLFTKGKGMLIQFPGGKCGTYAIPEGVRGIWKHAFYECTGLTEVSIPGSVTNVGTYAFYGCTGLAEVSIPGSVAEVGTYAFYGCRGLERLEIGDGVASIGTRAFQYCTGLTAITLPDSLTSLAVGVFCGCSGLADMSIPCGVTNIGNYAFSSCNGLATLTIPDNVVGVGTNAFNKSGLEVLYVPGSWEGTGMLDGTGVPSGCTVVYGEPMAESVGSVEWTYVVAGGAATVLGASPAEGAQTVPVAMGGVPVTGIMGGAFAGCEELTELTIPDCVTNIGKQAFAGSGLTTLTVPARWAETKILDNTGVPSGCKVVYGTPKSEIVGGVAWTYAVGEGVATVTGAEPAEGTLAIPLKLGGYPVTGIAGWAFKGCAGLTGLTIPDTVMSVGSQAFADSGLLTLDAPSIWRRLKILSDAGVPDGCAVVYRTVVAHDFISVPGTPEMFGGAWNLAANFLSTRSGADWSGSITPTASSGEFKFTANCTWYVNWGGDFSVLRVPVYNVGPLVSDGFNISWQNATVDLPHTFVFHEDASTFDIVPSSVPARAFTSLQLVGDFNRQGTDPGGVLTKSGNLWTGEIKVSGSSDSFLLRVDNQELWGLAAPTAAVLPVYDASFCGASSLDVSGIQQGTLAVTFDPANLLLSISQKSTSDTEPELLDGIKWFYSVVDGAATVTGAEPSEGVLEIPAELGGCPVTGIESNAFHGCAGLTNVVIPGTVTNIGRYAFNKCTGLLSVTIPASVKRVRYYAFSGCSSLEAVHIHDLAAWCGISFDTAYANPLYYARRLYLDGTEVAGELVIPDGVEQIGDFAFSHFSGATNLVIPSSVKRIGWSSFLECTGLTSVLIPGSVESIGNYAFADCGGLGTVEIPASVRSIGGGAFENCARLTGIEVASGNAAYESEEGVLFTKGKGMLIQFPAGKSGTYAIPDGVGGIGERAFYGCTGMTEVSIPGSVAVVGAYAFYECTGLSEVSIPGSVTAVGSYAFYGCRRLEMLAIGGGVASIGMSAFEYCTGLTTVDLPAGLANIGEGAFCGCSGLASVTIPGTVTNIASYAFAYCSGLETLEISESVERVGTHAFYESGLKTLYVPGSWEGTEMLNEANVPEGCQVWYGVRPGEETVDGVAWRYIVTDGVATVTGAEPAKGGLEVPEMLGGCPVTGIADNAFDGCAGLTSVAIGIGVTNIGECAFANCGGLEGIEVADGNVYYKSEDGVLFGKDGTRLIACPAGKSGVYVIPDGVTSIAAGAFCGCGGLTAVAIPAGVESVGDSAFAGCGGLARVCVPEDWKGSGMIEGAGLASMLAVVYGEAPEGEAEAPGEVVFEPEAGAWPEVGEEGVEVSMEAAPGAVIYYTLDGSRPVCTNAAGEVVWSATAAVYAGPVRVENGRDDGPGAISRIMTGNNEKDAYDPWFAPAEAPRTIPVVRAAAVGADGRVGEISTASYLLGDMAGRYGDTPVFSLCAEWADLFDNVNGPGIYRYPTSASKIKVKNAHVEFFDGGARQFAKWCELRGHGGTTLGRPKKSLRLTGWAGYAAGKEKKEPFDYPFFADEARRTNSTIILRMGGNDWNRAILRDRLAQEIGADEEVDGEAGATCVLFLNGVYWGVHEIRERLDSGWFSSRLGIGKKNAFSLLEYADQLDYPQVNEGAGEDDEPRTSVAYADFWAILRQLEMWNDDLSDEGRWAWFTNRVNADSLAAHFASSLFVGNSDWPWNNQRWWRAWPDGEAGASVDRSRPRNDGRWNWSFHDMDFAFALPFSYVAEWSDGLRAAHDSYAGIYPNEGPYVGTWVADASRAFRAAMSNEGFRNRFLARVYLRLATDWRPGACVAALERVADELRAAGMDENGARWRQPQTAADWERQIDIVRGYLRSRAEAFAWHTRKRYGLGAERTVVLGTDGEGEGSIRVAGRGVGGGALPLLGGFPGDLPLELEAVPAKGSAFAGWFAAPGLLPEAAEVARAEDCAANYGGVAGAFPVLSLGRGWDAWVREGGTAFTGTSAMPIHGRSGNGESFGLRAGAGEAGTVRRELADGAVLAVGEEMSLAVAFGLSGGNGGAGLAFVTAGGAEEPVRLVLAADEADGEAYRVTVDGAESIAENFPHIVGAPIRVALARTGETDYELRLERGGEIFWTAVRFSAEITGVRLWKNPYGYGEAKYDLWFDNLRAGAAVAGGEAEALETAVVRPVAFHATGADLSRWERNVQGIAEVFVANDLLCNIGTPAFGMRADGGGRAVLEKKFEFALTNGYELSFDFQNNAIDGAGAAAGVVFLTEDGEAFEFVAEAGSTNYLLRVEGKEDVDTGVPVVRTGVRVAISPREGGGMDVSVGGRVFTLDVLGDIDGIAFFDYGCGLEHGQYVYFNHVAVRCEPGTSLPEPERTPDFFETGNDSANWGFASSGGTNGGWAGCGSEDSAILGTAAFYLYAGGPARNDATPFASARRMFPEEIRLGAGAVLSFRFAHGAIGDESSAGIGNVGWELLGEDTASLAWFIATRDNPYYSWRDITLGVPKVADTPHDVELHFSSDTAFDLYFDGLLIARNATLDAPVRGLRFWNNKAGSGSGRNLLFNEIAVYMPKTGSGSAARRGVAPRETGETLLSADKTWMLGPGGDIAVVARFVPRGGSDLDVWAAERGIDDPWAANPETGRSHAEEYLLETNAVESLHGIEGGVYQLRFTPGEHGVDADVEVAESLVGSNVWRKAKADEMPPLEIGAPGGPGRLFIRLVLGPAE